MSDPQYSSTVENYVKQVFLLSEDAGSTVSMKDLVAVMEVAPGTVTAMMKTLSSESLVDYTPREGVRLTEQGRQLALRLVRRHRLIELFLVNVLRLDWSDVHEEAEILEHAVSDKIVERMDELLGRPRHGPHGKPIPDAEGNVEITAFEPLEQVPSGTKVRLAEIGEDDPELLRLVVERGFGIGVECSVEHDPTAGTVTLSRDDGRTLTLGHKPARVIFVDR